MTGLESTSIEFAAGGLTVLGVSSSILATSELCCCVGNDAAGIAMALAGTGVEGAGGLAAAEAAAASAWTCAWNFACSTSRSPTTGGSLESFDCLSWNMMPS